MAAEPRIIPRFTLDTNCLIAIEECRPEAHAIRALVQAHARNAIELNVVAISASEKQKDGKTLENFNLFTGRLRALGLEQCGILKPMLYLDLCFFDWAYWGSDEMIDLECRIHTVLFPNIEFQWIDYCRAHNLSDDVIDHKWRNAKCDTLALWSHIWHQGNVFVTSDKNFHAAAKQDALRILGAAVIVDPSQALGHIPVS